MYKGCVSLGIYLGQKIIDKSTGCPFNNNNNKNINKKHKKYLAGRPDSRRFRHFKLLQ